MQPHPNNPVTTPPASAPPLSPIPSAPAPNLASNVVAASTAASDTVRREFIWKTHDYTNNYIRFADTKAALIIALTSGLLASLLGVKAHHYCSPSRLNLREPVWLDSWLGSFAFLAFTFLILGFCCAMLTIAPRLWNRLIRGLWNTLKHMFSKTARASTIQPGFVYWSSILAHSSPENYYNALSAQNEGELARHLAAHQYVLGGIVEEKFLYVDRSIRFALLGGIIAGLFILASS